MLWRKHTAVPLNRIQHAEVVRGPFERLVRLATLTVYTAGLQNMAVSVRHLSRKVADEMLAQVLALNEDESEDDQIDR